MSGSLPDFTNTVIDYGRIHLKKLLGAGSFGAVYEGVDIQTVCPLQYAVKVMFTPAPGSYEEELQSAEIELHKRVSDHDNVVTLHEHIVEGPYSYTLLALCRGDNLHTRLGKRKFRQNDDFIRETMVQIIEGLMACHEKGVYHRDLKPENILTSRDGSRDRASTEFGVGTLPYMSPECIRSEYAYYYPQYNDIWSVGVIFVNLVTGCYPWDSAEWEDPLYRAYLGDPNSIAKTMPIRISAECNELFQCIFQVEPLRRISLSRLLLLIEQVDTFFLEPRIELPLPPPPCNNSGGGSRLMDIAITGISPPATPLGIDVRLPPMNVAERDIGYFAGGRS
ncbi:kinase-like domain-containing protein [Mucidula mucida]|nr:kinase-like domain-containing protein [Mucidula mucida]